MDSPTVESGSRGRDLIPGYRGSRLHLRQVYPPPVAGLGGGWGMVREIFSRWIRKSPLRLRV